MGSVGAMSVVEAAPLEKRRCGPSHVRRPLQGSCAAEQAYLRALAIVSGALTTAEIDKAALIMGVADIVLKIAI